MEITVSGVPIGRTKLGAVPYSIVSAETSCGPTTGPAMVDTGAGFCMDPADRAETAYGSAVSSCAAEGKIVCSFVQLCTARNRNVGALSATANYRVSDLMFFTGDNKHYLGAGAGGNALALPAACANLVAPGPNNAAYPFRCCRGKG